MYWSAAAMLSTRSAYRRFMGLEVARCRSDAAGLVGRFEQPVGEGDRDRGEEEGDVDDGLPHQHLLRVVAGVDEGFQQMDRADADDRGAELDLQDRGVDVAEPFGLVRMAFEVHPADE